KAALTKKAESRRNPQGWGGARVPCQTEWTILSVEPDPRHAHHHLVELHLLPHTGRKHQIRRHAALAGWPLVGDYRYGPAPEEGTVEEPLALHAWRLTFTDPETGENLTVEAPPGRVRHIVC